MKIKLAKNSGFCFGVKEAIKKAENTIIDNQGNQKKIYTCGSLIHNKIVTDDLCRKGVSIINNAGEAEDGSVVVVRSHGEPEGFYQEARRKNLEVVDATCPFVRRIQTLVKNAKEEGFHVVIVGNKNHPEIIGINGWCNNEAQIVNSVEDAKSVVGDNLFVVAQTTIRRDLFDTIVEILKESKNNVEVHNTICNATSERQQSCMETAKESEVMIIVGDRNSSNTLKLYEIAQKYCDNTYFVEDKDHLPIDEIKKFNKIGIAAGASTPRHVIQEIIDTIQGLDSE